MKLFSLEIMQFDRFLCVLELLYLTEFETQFLFHLTIFHTFMVEIRQI
jgi:hypothetical protein